VVAVLVPESDGGPHRAIGTQFQDTNERYFGRLGSTTDVLSHRHLAAMFNARAPARLQIRVEQSPAGKITVRVRNTGRGVAEDTRVRIRFSWTRPLIRPDVRPFDGWALSGTTVDVQVLSLRLLYPEDEVDVCSIETDRRSDGLAGSFVGRIDRRGGQPTRFDGEIPPPESMAVWQPDREA
jgi:hypothetical protein